MSAFLTSLIAHLIIAAKLTMIWSMITQTSSMLHSMWQKGSTYTLNVKKNAAISSLTPNNRSPTSNWWHLA
eukprot:8247730-Ditylum_brightwellii.AAC.1